MENLTKLKNLDISYNLIRTIENLEKLINLKKLYLVENKLKKVLKNLEKIKKLLDRRNFSFI